MSCFTLLDRSCSYQFLRARRRRSRRRQKIDKEEAGLIDGCKNLHPTTHIQTSKLIEEALYKHTMESNNPPCENFYKNLFENYLAKEEKKEKETSLIIQNLLLLQIDQEQLPLIDLSRLSSGDLESVKECKREIVEASKEWGFFQVVNHGISNSMLKKMLDEQMRAFRKPFDVKKANETDSYRWGTPTTAKRMNQFSWSEAFHIPLSQISNPHDHHHHFNTLRLTIDEFATTVSSLAQKIAEILGENLLGYKSSFFEENCSSETSYLRLNRYPPCPISSSSSVSGVDVFGLMPHTDSDFLTILYQDEVGGLQLIKDGRWLTVQPNPQALIINIGDLFQAWSNGVYKSVEHRVLTNKQVERFSTAYFLCPYYDSVIQSCGETPMYREFSFREFRRQVQEDVKTMGYKVGLPRFLI